MLSTDLIIYYVFLCFLYHCVLLFLLFYCNSYYNSTFLNLKTIKINKLDLITNLFFGKMRFSYVVYTYHEHEQHFGLTVTCKDKRSRDFVTVGPIKKKNVLKDAQDSESQ